MLGAASCHHRSFPCCGSMEGSGSHNVLNEDLIKDVLGGHAGHGSCKEFFGTKGNYEVFTIFAKTSEHLKAIDMSDLSAGENRRLYSTLCGLHKGKHSRTTEWLLQVHFRL